MKTTFTLIVMLLSFCVYAQNDSLRYPGYESAIRRADTAFAHKQYEKAKDAYELARVMRPRDKYAEDRIRECDFLIHEADMLAPDHNYTRYLALADSCFALSDFIRAKEYYRRASNIKPMEQYPKDKIRLIDGMVICWNGFFPQAIMAGDSLFLAGDYVGARIRYREAVALKAAETYPREQIKRCNDSIAVRSKQAEYTLTIAQADSLFAKKEYLLARSWYAQAVTLRPADEYPKAQMKRCDEFLKEEK